MLYGIDTMLISNDVSSKHSAHPFMWLNFNPDPPATVLSFVIFQPNRKLSLVRYVGSGGSTYKFDGSFNFLKHLCVASGDQLGIVNAPLSIYLQDIVSPIWTSRIL